MGGPVCRPYGIPEPLVYFVSAARLFTGDFLLPAGGASPSPTVSSKGSTYFVGTKHSAGGEISDGRPGVPPLRHTRTPRVFRRDRPRTFMEISRHRRADEDIRPYGIPEPLVYSAGADDSAARLFTGDSPLPAGGASPSPTPSSKGPTYLVGPTHSLPTGGCVFLRRKSMFPLDNKFLQM